MPSFLLAIDQGTTGSTALVISPRGEVLSRSNREFPQHFPQPGWVEHQAHEIWESVAVSVTEAIANAGLKAEDCLGIGITNQRETTLLWDRTTGEAVAPAIVWQDKRTAVHCDALKRAGHEALFQSRTGLRLDPYFSGTKMAWLLDQIDGARANSDLALGTIDAWLIFRLCGEHKTDVSNASRTLLMDLRSAQWDDELASILKVPTSMLPEICDSAEVYGHTKGLGFLPDGIPVAAAIGDQQAALFGQLCFRPGDAKCTYGTGAFLLMNAGDQPPEPSAGLLSTAAWRIDGKMSYALEGSAFIAGAAVQWLRDGLGLISEAREIEALASEVKDAEGVFFVPALAGLGAPYWEPNARGLISGLTRGTTRAHLCRATLDGIAHQITDLVGAMEASTGAPLTRLRVDGGACRNNLLMQIQADLLGKDVYRPKMVESTALGAAYLAGLAVGVFPNLEDIMGADSIEKAFSSQIANEARVEKRAGWGDAVGRAMLGESQHADIRSEL